MQARVHLRLTGPGGGDLGLILDDRRLSIIRENPRPPTTVVTMKAATLIDLLAGRTEFSSAQLTGKLRVEGEALAALVVQAIISRFRAEAPRPLQRLLFKGAVE
jgi:putative sterol carrier protein